MPDRLPDRPSDRRTPRRPNLIWLIGLATGVVAGALAVYLVAYGAAPPV